MSPTAHLGGAGQIGPNQTASAPAAAPLAPVSGPPQPNGPEPRPPESGTANPSRFEAKAAKPGDQDPLGGPRHYGMAPLIRGTLVGLYLALVLPLPVLAGGSLRPLLALAVPLGLLLVLAITSERVSVDVHGLALGHPPWCSWWLRRGWSLGWNEITGLTAVATSQGGRVYYLRSAKASTLLPQRLARFADFLAQLQQHSGLDTRAIGRLSPPWTYQLLAALTALMLLGELAALAVLPAASVLPLANS